MWLGNQVNRVLKTLPVLPVYHVYIVLPLTFYLVAVVYGTLQAF